MQIFGIHWNLTGGNNAEVKVTSIDIPPPSVGKWEMEEAYATMKKPTTQLMTLTAPQCKELINVLKQCLKENDVKDVDNW
jgi:hypothetical protein|tara:strand:- start:2490 stop:2729 length:240 start_codon:yes stop_codon:yes gene_type:complete